MDTDDWFSSNVITSDFVPFTYFPKFPLFKKMWNWSAYTKKSCCFTFYFNGTKNQKVIRSTQELFALLLKQENQKWKYKYKLIQLVCSDNIGRNFFFFGFLLNWKYDNWPLQFEQPKAKNKYCAHFHLSEFKIVCQLKKSEIFVHLVLFLYKVSCAIESMCCFYVVTLSERISYWFFRRNDKKWFRSFGSLAISLPKYRFTWKSFFLWSCPKSNENLL